MDDFDKAPVTYTIKAGKAYDDSWAVFHGTTAGIRREALALFDLNEADFEGQSTYDVLRAIEEIMQGEAVVSGVLGGKRSGSKGQSAWDSGEAAPEQDKQASSSPHADLIERLKVAASEDALKNMWAKNKDAFDDEDVKGAYVARRKELQAA